MKKLVTLMLALSLGGSQVFAAGSSAQEKSPAANLAIGGAIAATLLYLIAPQGENSFMAKLSTAFDAFVSGRATPAGCVAYVVNHFTEQATETGTNLLNSVQAGMLTDAQRLQAQMLANQQGWDVAEVEAWAGKLAFREQNAKIAPMFAVFRQLFGSQQAQQQSAVDQYLASGYYQEAESTIDQ